MALVLCAVGTKTWRAHSALAGEVASLRDAVAELPRLREEITRLNKSRHEAVAFHRSDSDHKDLAQLREELAVLKQRLVELTNSRGLAGRSVPDQPLNLPKEGWTNAGSSTWVSALQSFMWAARENDDARLKEFAWLPPGEEQAFQKEAGKLASVVAGCRGMQIGTPKYVRPDGHETLNGEVAFWAKVEVVFDGEVPVWEAFNFRRMTNGWRYSRW